MELVWACADAKGIPISARAKIHTRDMAVSFVWINVEGLET
jgi:hypothetical protein